MIISFICSFKKNQNKKKKWGKKKAGKLFMSLFFNFLSYPEEFFSLMISGFVKRTKKSYVHGRTPGKFQMKIKQIKPILETVDLIPRNLVFFFFSVNQSNYKKNSDLSERNFIFPQKKNFNTNPLFGENFFSPLPLEIYDIKKKTKDIVFVSWLGHHKCRFQNIIILIQKKISFFWNSFVKSKKQKYSKEFLEIFNFREKRPTAEKTFMKFQKGYISDLKRKFSQNENKQKFLEKNSKNSKFFTIKFYFEGYFYRNTLLFLVPKKGFFLFKNGNYYFLFFKKKVFFFIKITGLQKILQKNKIIFRNVKKNIFQRKKKYMIFVRISDFLSKLSIHLIASSEQLFLLTSNFMMGNKKNFKEKKLDREFFNFHFEEMFFWINSINHSDVYLSLENFETNDSITLKLLKLETEKSDLWDKYFIGSFLSFHFQRFFFYFRQSSQFEFSEREKLLQVVILKENHMDSSLFLMKVYFNEMFFELFLYLTIFFNNLEKLAHHVFCLEIFTISEYFLSWCLGLTVCSKRENILFLFFYKILKKIDLKRKLIYFLNKIAC